MNKKRVYTLLIILGVLVLAVLFYVSIPYIANAATRPVKSFNKEITAISCESEDIPYVEAYGNIYKGKKVISLFDLCEKICVKRSIKLIMIHFVFTITELILYVPSRIKQISSGVYLP